ncbi:hypothetical protein [Sinomonas sp. ASV322]|uniref:hypothetical protein n=1 Tax=Sinomonas sp. ASV322 TaxID=3041920 RepID=UPI0027DC093D|nr:hypothetical protein [Sinomonas sp. ASV322]MDQ4502938.1 hypothetical protein [Sinomonas sp. ASV322]
MMKLRILASTSIAIGMLLSIAVQAQATDDNRSTRATLERVTKHAQGATTKVLSNVAPIPTTDGGAQAIDGTANGVRVKVPTSAIDAISLESSTGKSVRVKLPYASNAKKAKVIEQGIVSFDNQNASKTVPVVKDDGSVQVTTVISGATAPARYTYELAVPDGGKVSQIDGGVVVVLDAAGGFVGGIAPAWAKDANGNDVPTRYEISGNTLTQVVDHLAASTAYPVVADPWFGIDLWGETWYNRRGWEHEDWTVSMLFSGWGWTVYSASGGDIVMLTAGWSEIATKRPLVTSKPSLKHQYDCHATFGRAWWWAGFHWDLERWRSNYPGWLATLAATGAIGTSRAR